MRTRREIIETQLDRNISKKAKDKNKKGMNDGPKQEKSLKFNSTRKYNKSSRLGILSLW